MSYTTVLAIHHGEKVAEIEELRNSYGSAPVVWNAMCQRYLHTEPYRCFDPGTLEKLWAMHKDASLPAHHRAVLMMTFDTAYVAKANYAQAAKDIRAWLADFASLIDPRGVNHWPRIADLFDSDPAYPGIGFYHTSVSDNPFQGAWNEEKEAYDPPAWDAIYEIYAELAVPA